MPRKGGDFERSFCKDLSLWWSGGTDDSLFWRTSQSGGRATVRARKGKRTAGHCGDVCATDPSSESFLRFVCLELKRGYPKASLHDLLDKPRGAKEQIWEKWIKQARRSRKLSGARFWMVVHKRDRREALCVFPREMLPTDERVFGDTTTIPLMTGGRVVSVMALSDWWFRFSPSRIRKYFK